MQTRTKLSLHSKVHEMHLILINEAIVKLYCLLSIEDAQRCLKFSVTLNTEHFPSANINGATEICLRSQKAISDKQFQFKKKNPNH